MRLPLPLTHLRFLAALLAVLLAAQSMLSSAWATAGSLHRHVQTSSSLRLSDFRRDGMARAPVTAAHAGTQRHHHGADDASVVRTAQDRATDQAAGAVDDAGGGNASALFIALLPELPSHYPTREPSPQVAHTPWTATAHRPSMPDRPPRA